LCTGDYYNRCNRSEEALERYLLHLAARPADEGLVYHRVGFLYQEKLNNKTAAAVYLEKAMAAGIMDSKIRKFFSSYVAENDAASDVHVAVVTDSVSMNDTTAESLRADEAAVNRTGYVNTGDRGSVASEGVGAGSGDGSKRHTISSGFRWVVRTPLIEDSMAGGGGGSGDSEAVGQGGGQGYRGGGMRASGLRSASEVAESLNLGGPVHGTAEGSAANELGSENSFAQKLNELKIKEESEAEEVGNDSDEGGDHLQGEGKQRRGFWR